MNGLPKSPLFLRTRVLMQSQTSDRNTKTMFAEFMTSIPTTRQNSIGKSNPHSPIFETLRRLPSMTLTGRNISQKIHKPKTRANIPQNFSKNFFFSPPSSHFISTATLFKQVLITLHISSTQPYHAASIQIFNSRHPHNRFTQPSSLPTLFISALRSSKYTPPNHALQTNSSLHPHNAPIRTPRRPRLQPPGLQHFCPRPRCGFRFRRCFLIYSH